MIKEIKTTCVFSGDNFYPDNLEEKLCLKFDYKHNVGDLCKPRGITYTYGYASIDYKENDYPSLEFLNKIEQLKKESLFFGLDTFYIDMAIYYENDCVIKFPEDILKKIADLEANLTISVYENSDDE